MPRVEIIDSDLSKNPMCPHGPTILFSRTIAETKTRNYFACGACRDRKDCNFFLWQDEFKKLNVAKKTIWKKENEKFLLNFNPKILEETFQEVNKCSQLDRFYCNTCQCFALDKRKHKSHNMRSNISNEDLQYPSKFLSPLDKPKREAQFLFSSLAVQTIVDIIKQMKIKNVLCVGAPRIHEHITNNEGEMKSILLDIDKRYGNFYDCNQFYLYNMFNNHFFLPESRKIFENFLKDWEDDILMITDPPFGGRIEPLAKTIHSMWSLYNRLREENSLIRNGKSTLHKRNHVLKKPETTFPVFFIFPYFMEPKIKHYLPEFRMSDYKVDYDNHPLFNDGPKGRKQGSPVRIFTNVNLSDIKLPIDQGYKYCTSCNIWVSEENQHCNRCDKCTSKDGRTYVHCILCRRCVKPTWKHCNKCKKCAIPDHKCRYVKDSQTRFRCNQEEETANCKNLTTTNKSKRKGSKIHCKVKRSKLNKRDALC